MWIFDTVSEIVLFSASSAGVAGVSLASSLKARRVSSSNIGKQIYIVSGLNFILVWIFSKCSGVTFWLASSTGVETSSVAEPEEEAIKPSNSGYC